MNRRKENEHLSEAEARRLLAESVGGGLASAVIVVLKGRHHSGWLTITEAAELANLSVRSLQRKLAASGVVFSELVDQARAELAVEMLKDTEVSVDDIVTILGYSSSSNFARAFQRWQGMAPSEYRRRL